LHSIVSAKVDHLTLWNVKIEGEMFDPYDNKVEKNDINLCCYFNLGIDAEIGTSNLNLI
jgi:hypothetical protein